jgi:cation/acetate symporter
MATADTQIAEIQKQLISADALGMMKKNEKAAAEKQNAALQVSAAEKAKEKEQLAAKKKEAGSNMPKAIFPLKNPGIYSMAAAFLMAFLVSIMNPEKAAEDKFAGVKVREYLGIGSED